MNPQVSFCLNPAFDEQNNPLVSLKITSETWELNIFISKEELELFQNVKDADWKERNSLIIGKCLNHPTYWSYEKEKISILVGKDDECWEVGVLVEDKYLEYFLTEIEKTKKEIKENKFWI